MRRRKNFLPTLIITILFWIATIYIILYVSPSSITIYYLLFTIFFSLFLILSLLLANTRRSFLLAIGMTIFLFLRFLKIANLLTILLLISSLTALEIYFRR